MPEKSALLLEDIADKLEETMEHWEQYFNKKTRGFVLFLMGLILKQMRSWQRKLKTPVIMSGCRISTIFMSTIS